MAHVIIIVIHKNTRKYSKNHVISDLGLLPSKMWTFYWKDLLVCRNANDFGGFFLTRSYALDLALSSDLSDPGIMKIVACLVFKKFLVKNVFAIKKYIRFKMLSK